jgi:preprotein translocase subunit SecA
MERLGIAEDEPIQNSFITKTLENAQARIEGFNFDARKHTLEYDDVMNVHRNTVYKKRKEILFGDENTLESFILELSQIDPEIESISKKKREEFGDVNFFETLRRIILYITDTLWVNHLETMEYIRSSVNLRAYGQRDPVIEYKKEALRLFREMEERSKVEIVSLIKTMNIEGDENRQNVVEEKQELILNLEKEQGTVQSSEDKIGRNDPCPCGSGKKYKKCHGK